MNSFLLYTPFSRFYYYHASIHFLRALHPLVYDLSRDCGLVCWLRDWLVCFTLVGKLYGHSCTSRNHLYSGLVKIMPHLPGGVLFRFLRWSSRGEIIIHIDGVFIRAQRTKRFNIKVWREGSGGQALLISGETGKSGVGGYFFGAKRPFSPATRSDSVRAVISVEIWRCKNLRIRDVRS